MPPQVSAGCRACARCAGWVTRAIIGVTAALAAGGIAGCGGRGDTAGGTVAPPARPADSFPAGATLQLTIAPAAGTAFIDSALVAGEAPAVTLTARTADGSALALPDTLTVRWTTSAAAVLGAPSGAGAAGTVTAVGPGTAQLAASVSLRRDGAPVAATASVTRAVRAESLTVFALTAPSAVRTNRPVALALDARGRRGTPVAPIGLRVVSSAPAVVAAPSVPAALPAAPLALPAIAGGTAGTATLTAQALGQTATTAITVTAPPVPIELVFEADAPAALRTAFRQAADRWEDVFTAPLADAGVQNVAAACNTRGPAVTGKIRGVRVFVFVLPDSGYTPTAAALASICDGVVSPATPLGTVSYGARPRTQAVLGGVTIRSSLASNAANFPAGPDGAVVYLANIGVHELGHVLGIGVTWDSPARFDYSDTADYRMKVPAVVAAFTAAGGHAQGAKAFGVPVEMAAALRGHWRGAVFSGGPSGGEVMAPSAVSTSARAPLSAITLAALQGLGYPVDLGAADAFAVPAAGGTPSGPSFARGVANPRGSSAGSAIGRVRPGDPVVRLGDDAGRRGRPVTLGAR